MMNRLQRSFIHSRHLMETHILHFSKSTWASHLSLKPITLRETCVMIVHFHAVYLKSLWDLICFLLFTTWPCKWAAWSMRNCKVGVSYSVIKWHLGGFCSVTYEFWSECQSLIFTAETLFFFIGLVTLIFSHLQTFL